PSAAAANPPPIPTEGLDAALREAGRLIARLRLGRSLRWKSRPRGERFDLRRTLRASLRTGGDLLEPHTLGHPLRNPRFVVLLDGSRSMSEHAPRMLQFAYALCRRSRRADAFLFSTQLQEVTRKLRDALGGGSCHLEGLGEAWGGGTRIGASLTEFLRKYAARLSDQTFVIIVSDGLDVGDIPQLQRAMRELARRCAAVAWLNPDASLPGYAPSARGIAAALPYVTIFTSFDRMDALTKLGRRSRMAA
ncbi:MAG: VWA domain-containing protein, partial [Candidatus Cybelea sp.]